MFFYDSSGMLENFHFNVPTLAIWTNKSELCYNHINNEFIEKYELLKESGILFDNLDLLKIILKNIGTTLMIGGFQKHRTVLKNLIKILIKSILIHYLNYVKLLVKIFKLVLVYKLDIMNKKNKKIAIISSSPLMMMLGYNFIENGDNVIIFDKSKPKVVPGAGSVNI